MTPVHVGRPIGVLELVLHIEEPHAGRASEKRGRNLDQEERHQPDDRDEDSGEGEDGGVGRHCTDPGTPAGATHEPERQSLGKKEYVERADAEKDERMPVDAIGKPTTPAKALIFAHRHRGYVADAAMGKIADTGVMHGVSALPMIMRG